MRLGKHWAGLLGLLLSVVGASQAIATDQSACSSYYTVQQWQAGNTTWRIYHLHCTGACGGENCAPGGSDPSNQYCTCPGESEPTCCHLTENPSYIGPDPITGGQCIGLISAVGDCSAQRTACPTGSRCEIWDAQRRAECKP